MENSFDRQQKSSSLAEIAQQLNTDDLHTLLTEMAKHIRSHADEVGRNDTPSILTSRFMPAQQAYDTGIISCGAIANISSEMLKNLGYQVKLVHGSIPSTPTHAWIAIKDTSTETWRQYDLTRRDAQVTPDHHTEFIVDDWNEMRDVIEGVYKNNHPTIDS